MKQCIKCNELLPVDCFYKEKKRLYYRTDCKECCKKYHRLHRKNNPNHYRYFDKKHNAKRVEQKKEYLKTEKAKKLAVKNSTKWMRNNRFKRLAQKKLIYAVKSGKIKKGNCQVCNSNIRIHGHHEDYTKPLEVIWLCSLHHNELHAEKRHRQGV